MNIKIEGLFFSWNELFYCFGVETVRFVVKSMDNAIGNDFFLIRIEHSTLIRISRGAESVLLTSSRRGRRSSAALDHTTTTRILSFPLCSGICLGLAPFFNNNIFNNRHWSYLLVPARCSLNCASAHHDFIDPSVLGGRRLYVSMIRT